MNQQRTRNDQLEPANHGSRTMTVTANSTQSSSSQPDAAAGPSQPAVPAAGVLHLRGTGDSRARVQWQDGTVDNEGLGRKKSKICCIYHKPKKFDESSDESDSDGESCGSDDSRNGHSHNHAHHNHQPHNPVNGSAYSSSTAPSANGSSTMTKPAPPTAPPNAYERQPKEGAKGKGRAN